MKRKWKKEDRRKMRGERGGETPQSPTHSPLGSFILTQFLLGLSAAVRHFQPEPVHRLLRMNTAKWL